MIRIGYVQLVIGVLVAALVLVIVANLALAAARGTLGERLANSPWTQSTAARVEGEYSGQVTLEGVYTGVYSDTREPITMTLGTIDLGLVLEECGDDTCPGEPGQGVTGHVVLSRTLVFTQEHTIGGEAVGPLVSGTFDGTTLHVESEKFSWVVSAGRTLPTDGRVLPERRATRQFSLVSTEVHTTGAQLDGIYRETIWGIRPDPVTVVGTFSLHRPVFSEQWLQVIKNVDTGGLIEVPPGSVVTYTIVISNSADVVASSVVMTDPLPSAVSFGDHLQGSALLPLPDNVYQWGPYDVAAHTAYTITFTAEVTSSTDFAGDTIVNIAYITAANADPDTDPASFTIAGGGFDVYLPLVLRDQ
jgi:uncharacterized repeat protein (TIGR01451 family)